MSFSEQHISFDTRALVAAHILAALIDPRDRDHAGRVAKAVRMTEDLLEGLERLPHGSFADEPTPPPSRIMGEAW